MKKPLTKELSYAQRLAFRYLQEVTNVKHNEEPKVPIGYSDLYVGLTIGPYSSFEFQRTHIISFPVLVYSAFCADESRKRVFLQIFQHLYRPTIDVKEGKLIRKPTRHEIYVAALEQVAKELLGEPRAILKEIKLGR
jgi:hypothetical protein